MTPRRIVGSPRRRENSNESNSTVLPHPGRRRMVWIRFLLVSYFAAFDVRLLLYNFLLDSTVEEKIFSSTKS